MSLQIGFSNKFYTLWNVSSEDVHAEFNGKHYLSHTITKFSYIQNLSFDLDKAIESAKNKGCSNTAVNDELKGKQRTFSNVERFEKPTYDDFQFTYGKYESKDIRECDDLSYLKWYFNDSGQECKVSMIRIAELDSTFSIINGKLVSDTNLVYAKIMNGDYELTAFSNFKIPYYEHLNNSEVFIKVGFEATTDVEFKLQDENPYGISIEVDASDLNLIKKSYNGIDYFTPAGMRSFKKTVFNLVNGKVIVK